VLIVHHASTRYWMNYNPTRMTIGEQLKNLRTLQLNLDQLRRLFDEHLISVIDNGASFADVGKRLEIPKATIYRWYQDARRREALLSRDD